MWLGSGVGVADSCSSDSTHSLEPPYATSAALKNKTKQKSVCVCLDVVGEGVSSRTALLMAAEGAKHALK